MNKIFNGIRAFWADVDRFVFAYGSPSTMAVFRIFLGACAFLGLLLQSGDLFQWYGNNGYVPVEMAQRWNGTDFRINPLANVTDPTIVAVAFGVVMIAALFTCIGFKTRVSNVVLALGIISLNHRNPFILNGGDTLLRNACMLMCLAPSGLNYSVDRWLATRKNPDLKVPHVSLWPQRLIQYQWAVMYFTTVWAKEQGQTWRDGSATWYPPQLTEFHKFPFPSFFDQAPFIQFGTYAALIVELALATLIFTPTWRKWAVLGGLLLHGYIEYRFNIPMFAFIATSGYVMFYSGEEVEAWIAKKWTRFQHGQQLSEAHV